MQDSGGSILVELATRISGCDAAYTHCRIISRSAGAIIEPCGNTLGIDESRRLELNSLDAGEILGGIIAIFDEGYLVVIIPNSRGQASTQEPSEGSTKRHCLTMQSS